MKVLTWSEKKNEWLKFNRKISFEDIVEALGKKDLVMRIPHYNQRKYPQQEIYVVFIKNYIYLVPFIIRENEIFLITIFASRKYKKLLFKQFYEKKIINNG